WGKLVMAVRHRAGSMSNLVRLLTARRVPRQVAWRTRNLHHDEAQHLARHLESLVEPAQSGRGGLMRATMCRLIACALLCAGTTAGADSDSATWRVAATGTEITQSAIGAKISLANCLALVRFKALRLAPDDASIAALAQAAKESLELIDAAIAAGDPTLTP